MTRPQDPSIDPVMRELRSAEFGRLDEDGHAYLDYTGSGLYGISQIRRHVEALESGVFGNPHSDNPTSSASTARVERVRSRVLEFFGADPGEYDVIFTQNASGALKLIAESFPFGPGSRYVLTADNHNSVNGIREYARAAGAEVRYVPIDEAELRTPDPDAALEAVEPARPSLFAFPAQSNFSGVKHPLEWVERARSRGYTVLLDAAAFVPTNPLRLSQVAPDFVAVSFYKMFGYPTGVGALIARKQALAGLRRPWFAGGTVRFASAQNALHLLEADHAAFEDGTLNFLGIAALEPGLDLLERVGIDRIGRHVARLLERLLSALAELRHEGGAPLIRIYGPHTLEARGGTVAFNLLDPDGREIDCDAVEERATEAGISLRAGCFCNPGAAEAAFGFRAEDAYRCFEEIGPDAWDLQRFSGCMDGKPVGAVRASLGIASSERDIERLVECLATFRDRKAVAAGA